MKNAENSLELVRSCGGERVENVLKVGGRYGVVPSCT